MPDTTSVPLDSEELLEDLETQKSKIADQLSELSSAEDSPSGYKVRRAPFDPNEVDFTSSSWLLRVLQVQAWLYPDTDVSPKEAEAAPFNAATKLFHAIGSGAPQECVSHPNGIVQLTSSGAEYLSARLDIAVRLQQAFAELLESAGPKQATRQWSEDWEEGEDDVEVVEPIKAKTATWWIALLSGKASIGQLNLSPSYQRGDVWPTADAQKLIESILRGIPLPSIILLKPRSTHRINQYEVVDGKQRLTSILRFIGKHPKAVARVTEADKRNPEANFLVHFNKNYRTFKRLWKTYEGEVLSDSLEAKYYFPFRLPQKSRGLTGRLAGLAGRYYCEITEEQIEIGDGLEQVSVLFDGPSNYSIPLIEYTDATAKQIHEVFHLYNKQGKHLNAEEIRNALFHELDLTKLMLAASGDNPNVKDLAPYFSEDDCQLFPELSKYLDDYRFGTIRYKKTKILAWLVALIFQPAINAKELTIRSTAKQIDALLGSIQANPAHLLADRAVLVQLIRDIHRCLDIHSTTDCWDTRFRDNENGSKWQELQLVASLVGVFLLCASVELQSELSEEAQSKLSKKAQSELLEIHRDKILEFTRNHPRPVKTQNKEQWAFIGEVALGIINLASVNEEDLNKKLLNRYGFSCLTTLQAAKALYEPPAQA